MRQNLYILKRLVLKLVRKAKYDDINIINKLGSMLHDNFVTTFHMETEINNPDAIILVAEENNIIVGYLYALQTIDNIDLLSIIVDEDYRRKKIATNMLKYLVSNYCYQNKTITLEVANSNISAIKFYEKIGFKVVNVRKHYYKDADAYLMKWGG